MLKALKLAISLTSSEDIKKVLLYNPIDYIKAPIDLIVDNMTSEYNEKNDKNEKKNKWVKGQFRIQMICKDGIIKYRAITKFKPSEVLAVFEK